MSTQERPATTEEIASITFEPLTPEELEIFTPPTNEEWRAMTASHLVMLRIAQRFMSMTKPEIIEALRKTDDCDPLFESFELTRAFFEAWSEFMKTAEARILIAGAALGHEDDVTMAKK